MENPNLKGYVALLNTEPQYHFSGFSIAFVLMATCWSDSFLPFAFAQHLYVTDRRCKVMLLSPLFLPSKKEKVPSCFSLQMKETLKKLTGWNDINIIKVRDLPSNHRHHSLRPQVLRACDFVKRISLCNQCGLPLSFSPIFPCFIGSILLKFNTKTILFITEKDFHPVKHSIPDGDKKTSTIILFILDQRTNVHHKLQPRSRETFKL